MKANRGFARWIVILFPWVVCAICAGQREGKPLPESVPLRKIVEEAIEQGSRVILRRVEYEEAGGAATGEPDGSAEIRVRSRTYIEIDTRSTDPDDGEMIESQKKVEESQREMIRAVEAIGKGQERHAGTLSGIEGAQMDLSTGMKSSAREQAGIRGETAGTGGRVSDVDRTIQDSGRLLKRIDAQIKGLSSAVSELSSRVEGVGKSVDKAAQKAGKADKIELDGGEDYEGGEGQESGSDSGGDGKTESEGGGGEE